MFTVKKSFFSAFLLSLTTPLFAASINCKQIPNTVYKQCTDIRKHHSKLYGFTNMPYALCSKALCTLDKQNPNQARCSCTLYTSKSWTSLSVSPTNHTKAKPVWNQSKQLVSVQSNYSLANMAATPNAGMIKCQFKKAQAWTNCFGIRCQVSGPHTATCICPVLKTKAFAITGPGNSQKCITKTNQAWSAITDDGSQVNTQFINNLYKTLYPTSPIATQVK